MNRCVIAMVASSLLSFTAGIAAAQTARARIADTPVRGEASLASAIIATLKAGAPVEVVDLQGEWYRVLVPSEPGRTRVGYVLAHLIEISPDGSRQTVAAPATDRAAPPVTQGPPIPPTLAQLQRQRDRSTGREEALRAEVDALQAEVRALQNAPRAAEDGRRDPEAAIRPRVEPADEQVLVQRPQFRSRELPRGAQYEVYGAYSPVWDNSDGITFPLGWAASFAGRVNETVSLVGEAGGSHKGADLLGINVAGLSIYTFVAGPRFSIHASKQVSVYGQVLGGLAISRLSVLGLSASSTGFALMPGAGVDVPVGHDLAMRVGGEYGFIWDGGLTNAFRFTTGLVLSR
jgi:Bacterial SH3 domain